MVKMFLLCSLLVLEGIISAKSGKCKVHQADMSSYIAQILYVADLKSKVIYWLLVLLLYFEDRATLQLTINHRNCFCCPSRAHISLDRFSYSVP